MNFGEYLPDLPDRDNPGLTVAKNCVPHGVSYKELSSQVVYSDALTARARGFISALASDGTPHNYAGDATSLYSLSSASWADVTSLAGTYSTDNWWEFTKWGEKIIGVNGHTDSPQIITMGGANFADLSGSPPAAKHIAAVRDFVVLGNINDGTAYPSRLHWSAINDETSWTAGTDQSDVQDLLTGGWIQRIIGGEYGIVFCDSSIYRMTYVGYPFIFQIDEVEPGRGTPAPGSVVQFGDAIFYLGRDGFYIFNGAVSTPIGVNKIDKTFYADLDQNYYDRIYAVIDPINTLVFWSYPGTGNTSGLSNRIICYNWATQRWSGPIETEQEILISSLSDGYTLDSLGAAYSSLDALPFSLDSRVWQGGSVLLSGFNSDHKLVNFTGDALTAEFETGEVNLNAGGRAFINGVRPLFDGDGTATIQIGARNMVNGTVTYTAASAQNSQTGICDQRSNAYYHRIKMTISGGFSHAYGYEPYFRQAGRK